MGKLNRFEMKGVVTWKGTTKENHLSAAFGGGAQRAANFMVQLLAYHRGKTLDTFLSQFPVKEFESDDEYYWDVVGSSRKNLPLIEARDIDGTVVTDASGMIGAGVTPFYLVFDQDWFADGEVVFGNLNQVYPMRILGDARFEGTNAVYKVELMGGNTDGIPAERLLAGERFSVEYAPVERSFSRKVGDIRFATPISVRNEWSTVRIQHKEGGSMLNKKIAVGVPLLKRDGDKVTRTTATMWMHNVDYELEVQFSEYKNSVMAYGTSNRNSNGEYLNFGKSGEVIRMGAGLYEQMEYANTTYYNDFSLKLLEDALYDISYTKLGLGERTFVVKTGEIGAIKFHKAVLNEASGWTQFILDNNSTRVVQKTTSNLHENALKAGFQFTEYLAPNGVRIKIEVDPHYDDPVRNKILIDGKPAMSSRFDIMDIGSSNEPNIYKCQIKGQPEYRGIQYGLRDPYTGRMTNMNMSFDEDAAVFHKMATLGVCVLDPTRTLSLIPAVLQG